MTSGGGQPETKTENETEPKPSSDPTPSSDPKASAKSWLACALDRDGERILVDVREANDLKELLTLLGVACGAAAVATDEPQRLAIPVSAKAAAGNARAEEKEWVRIAALVREFNAMRSSRLKHS